MKSEFYNYPVREEYHRISISQEKVIDDSIKLDVTIKFNLMIL